MALTNSINNKCDTLDVTNDLNVHGSLLVDGLLVATGGVELPTTGHHGDTLSYFEEAYPHVTNWSNAFAATPGNLLIMKLNNRIWIDFPMLVASCNNTTMDIVMNTVLPGRFCPSVANVYLPFWAINNGLLTIGQAYVQTDGNIFIRNGVNANTSYVLAQNAGFQKQTICYTTT